jgi:hypothetical protein
MPSARDIAFIGCRLLALFALYRAVLSVEHSILAFLQIQAASEAAGMVRVFASSLYSAPVISLLTHVAVFLVLWVGAGWIAGRVSAGAPEGQEPWTRRSALSVAVVALGLAVLVLSVHRVIDLLQWLLIRGMLEAAGAITTVLLIGLGIAFILGAGAITDFIAKLRRW